MNSPLKLDAAPEDVGLSPERLENVSRWMTDWVDSGRLPCAMTAVLRRDKLVYLESAGLMDVEAATRIENDTIFRIYSMTKPITSVAAMMLYEQGLFQLDDPVSKFIPALGDMQVFRGGDARSFQTEPANRDITVRDLMSHTSGLTYDWLEEGPVDEIYRDRKISFQESGLALAELVDRLGDTPLLCQPGSQWNYSVSTDVLGHLVEVLSGEPLDKYLDERIFAPLGMTDTGFSVPADKTGRFAALYSARKDASLKLIDAPATSKFARPAVTFSGGGGLTSTMADYIRFTRMLSHRGQLDGARLLSPKTVDYMTTNHLPGDLTSMGQPTFSETSYDGIGFGLGFAVMLDPARAQVMGSPGEYNWGGAASTAFWIDPVEDMTVIFLTQLLPSSTYPLRRQLRVLTYQAIVE